MLPDPMTYNSATVMDFIVNLSGSTDFDEAMDVLQDAGQTLGLPLVDYASMPSARRVDGTWVPPQMATRNFPDGWDRNYERHRPHDPYFHASYAQSMVLDWAEVRADREAMTAHERDCLDYISDAGLLGGVTIPIHMSGSRFAFVSLLEPPNRGSEGVRCTRVANTAFLIAHLFHSEMHSRFRMAEAAELTELSTRERQCLSWSAEGRTVDDIAVILGLSPETVRIYLKRAMRKLSSLNRTHAVAKAISLGLIDAPQALAAAERMS